MEPTSGLEQLTCRLRIDPVLRMLLCDKDYSRAYWGVFEHSGDHFYSTWYSSVTSRFQIGRHGHFPRGTAPTQLSPHYSRWWWAAFVGERCEPVIISTLLFPVSLSFLINYG